MFVRGIATLYFLQIHHITEQRNGKRKQKTERGCSICFIREHETPVQNANAQVNSLSPANISHGMSSNLTNGLLPYVLELVDFLSTGVSGLVDACCVVSWVFYIACVASLHWNKCRAQILWHCSFACPLERCKRPRRKNCSTKKANCRFFFLVLLRSSLFRNITNLAVPFDDAATSFIGSRTPAFVE